MTPRQRGNVESMERMMRECASQAELDRVAAHYTTGWYPDELPRAEIARVMREVELAKGWRVPR